ncbi:MAG: hypothetical protein ACK4OK_09900, partial [Thermoflexus sp.]
MPTQRIGALQAAFGAKVSPDVVRITNIRVGPVFTVSDRGDEVGGLAWAHIAPGKEASRWNIGQEGDWWFVFYLIKREAGWRLARGAPLPPDLAEYLQGNRRPFQNVTIEVPGRSEPLRVATFSAGMVLGELAFLDGSARSARAVAVDAC